MNDRWMVFSKHLWGPSLDETGRRLAEMNVGAIDLTVRPGGHVEPERAADDLPAAAEALGEHDVRIGMITTQITDATEATTESILRTASRLRIRYYKLGYWRYHGFRSIKSRRGEVAARLRDLAALNLEYGIHGGFHNHSADFFGALPGDTEAVLEQVAPEAIGVYFDPAHASIEGSSYGWLMGMDLLADRITMLAVKDYRWIPNTGRHQAGRLYSSEFCPLGEGNTCWPSVVECLNEIGFNGPVSFHSEYQGPHSFQDLSVDEVFEQTRKDVQQFACWTEAARGRSGQIGVGGP